MAKPLPDLGSYTPDETMALAIHAMGELGLDHRIAVVRRAFSKEEREELVVEFGDENDEGEEA